MRENQGSAIVKELTGKEVITVLDPVLMFNADSWNKLIPVKTEFSEPYIFAYFLGRNTKFREAVKEMAEKTGYKIVTLRHLDQYIEEDEYFGDYAPYDIDPAEFLNMLRGASFVCTDSFHGSVFSIIYRKKFIVFNRYDEESKHSKNSRIDTICKNLGLENRRYNGELYKRIIEDIDYDAVYKKYKILQKAADKYLNEAFSSVDDGAMDFNGGACIECNCQ